MDLGLSHKKNQIPTIKELKERCIDRTRAHPGMDLFVAEMATYISKIFLYTSIRPLQIMFFWFVLQIISCVIIAKGTPLAVVLGVLLYQFATVLDYVDGQVARIKQEGKESLFALYLDQVYHWINHPLLFLSLSLAAGNIWVGLGVVALFLYNKIIIFNPSMYNLKNERAEMIAKKVCWSRQKVEERNIFTRLTEVFRLGLLFNMLFIGAVLNILNHYFIGSPLNFILWTLYLYGLLYVVEFWRKLIYIFIKLKEVDQEINLEKNLENKSQEESQQREKSQQGKIIKGG